jgi:hypothetical protein
MRVKRVAVFFLEIVVVLVMLTSLGAVAVPHAGRMLSSGRAMAREVELENIEAAVTRMLGDSAAGTLEPVGPTADMSYVRTNDVPSLVLQDYLPGAGKCGGAYAFTSDGTVILLVP